MSQTITGHYNKQKEKIKKDFGRTISLISGSLDKRFGSEFSRKLQEEVLGEYEQLILKIPYTRGFLSRIFNRFILITAQELAAYKALRRYDIKNEEIWELCYEALCLRLEAINLWKRRLISLFWQSIFRNMLKMRARRNKKEWLAGFELEYILGQGDDFDFGINYTNCGSYEFMKKHGGEEFAPYVCMSDIALNEAFNWGLIRTQTLADGCDYCDFRFKKDARTQITSKLPEVQRAVEKTGDQYKVY